MRRHYIAARRAIARLATWLLMSWRQQPEVVVDPPRQPEPTAPPVGGDVEPKDAAIPAPVHRAAAKVSRKDAPNTENSTTWHFKSVILDRLDEYFVCIRRVRRLDPSAYAMFSRLGLAVPAERFANGSHPENIAKAVANRVSFGGVLQPQTDVDDKGDATAVLPSFMYFRKVSHPPRVRSFPGDVYELTVLYDYRHGAELRWLTKRLTALCRCHIGMAPDGTLSLLKEHVSVTSKVQPARVSRGRRKPQSITLTTHQWQYPEWVLSAGAERDKTPDEWAVGLLVMALATYTESISRLVVRVKKRGCVAAFGIETDRAKYFFADRDTSALARDGKRKRIFHAVTAHERRLASGRTSNVKHHYRGIRAFDWNGYGINIVLPTNNYVMDFDKPAHDAENVSDRDRDKFIDEKAFGETLGELLEA